jgi:hypothetical protein
MGGWPSPSGVAANGGGYALGANGAGYAVAAKRRLRSTRAQYGSPAPPVRPTRPPHPSAPPPPRCIRPPHPKRENPHRPVKVSQHIRDRIQRKLSGLSEDRLYQVLDFVEFLELKYPAAQPSAPANPLQRFADGIEDRLRAGGLAASTVSEAMGFLNKAVGVLGNVATAAQTAAQRVGDVVAEAAQAGPGGPTPPPAGSTGTGASGTGPATGDGAPPAAPGGPATPPPSDRPQ